MPLYRRMEPNAMILDFKCVEFVEELIYGEYRRRNPLPRFELARSLGRVDRVGITIVHRTLGTVRRGGRQ